MPGSAAVSPGRVALATGPELRFVEWGDPEGKAVVLLHGYTDSSLSFSPLVPFLRGRRFLAVDQRGHGESDRPDAGYGMADLGRDVVAFLDAMEIDRASLVGHSMGSFVAQQAVLAAPDRFDRLVLVGAAASARTPAVWDLAREVSVLEDPVPPAFAREFQAATAHAALPESFLDRVAAESLRLPAWLWKALMIAMLEANWAARIPEIRVPALVVWGEKDGVFPREAQEALVAALRRVAFLVYPDTGHAVHWERPDRFARDLETFLEFPA